ncbi:hypothetical protein GCM10028801_36110 [Nocardioides maradonensis]
MRAKRPFMPTEYAGLVLEWKQTPDGWQALVIYVEPGGAAHLDWFARREPETDHHCAEDRIGLRIAEGPAPPIQCGSRAVACR